MVKPKTSNPEKIIKGRPGCVECGALNPNSEGLRWSCRSCGRKWMKNYRGRLMARELWPTDDTYKYRHFVTYPREV